MEKQLHGVLGLRGWHDRHGPPEVHLGRWGLFGERRRVSRFGVQDVLRRSCGDAGHRRPTTRLTRSIGGDGLQRFSFLASPRGEKWLNLRTEWARPRSPLAMDLQGRALEAGQRASGGDKQELAPAFDGLGELPKKGTHLNS